MKKVSIIILNYKQKELTVNCVKSVLGQKYDNIEIILVDNGSNDGSFELFKKEFSKDNKIKIIKSEKNRGYTGGNNFGYKYCKGKYVVVLNNDTIVGKNWLSELVKSIEKEKDIAAVSSHIIEPHTKHVRIDSEYWTTNLIGEGVLFKFRDNFEKDTFIPSGCSFIIKKDVASKALFPEDYFAYAEEVFLGWSLRNKGYKIKTNIKSFVNHYHGAVRKSNRHLIRYFTFLGERNRLANCFIFPEPLTIMKILPIIILGALLRNVAQPLKIPWRFKSYFWLALHPGFVSKKRKIAQKERVVRDAEVMKFMSSKFYEPAMIHNKILRKIVIGFNKLMEIYCSLVRLKTLENSYNLKE